MQILQRSLAGIALLFAASPAWSQARPVAPAPAAPPPPAAAPAPAAPAPAAAAPAPVLAPAAPAPAPTPPGPTPGGAPVVLAPATQPLPPPGPAPAPAAAPVEAAPVAAVPVAPPAPPPAPDRLSIGKNGGIFQPNALLQAWGFYSDEPTPTSTFRIRRAEIKIKGDISPGLVSYGIMFDPAKLLLSRTVQVAGPDPANPTTVGVLQPTADGGILQDLYVTFQSEYADVSIGQFKTLVSLEGGMTSASKLLFPERALVSRLYGDKRDLGVKIEKKIGDYFYYQVGLYNGSGLNHLDDDNEKDVGLRLEVYPVAGLTVAGAGYTTVGERDGLVRDRVEGDLRYDANDVFFIGEYIHGWDGPEGGRFDGHGVYGGLGYTFVKRIQPIVRVGMLDPNLDVSGNRTAHYEFGMNYYLRGQEARIGLSASAFDPQAGNTRWEGILAVQASF